MQSSSERLYSLDQHNPNASYHQYHAQSHTLILSKRSHELAHIQVQGRQLTALLPTIQLSLAIRGAWRRSHRSCSQAGLSPSVCVPTQVYNNLPELHSSDTCLKPLSQRGFIMTSTNCTNRFSMVRVSPSCDGGHHWICHHCVEVSKYIGGTCLDTLACGTDPHHYALVEAPLAKL